LLLGVGILIIKTSAIVVGMDFNTHV